MIITASSTEPEALSPTSTATMIYKQFIKRQIIVNSTISTTIAVVYMTLWFIGVGFCLCYCRRQSSSNPKSKSKSKLFTGLRSRTRRIGIGIRGKESEESTLPSSSSHDFKKDTQRNKEIERNESDTERAKTSPIQRIIITPPNPKRHKLRFIVNVNDTNTNTNTNHYDQNPRQGSHFYDHDHDQDDIHTNIPSVSSLTTFSPYPHPGIPTVSTSTKTVGAAEVVNGASAIRPVDGTNANGLDYPYISPAHWQAAGGVGFDGGSRRTEEEDSDIVNGGPQASTSTSTPANLGIGVGILYRDRDRNRDREWAEEEYQYRDHGQRHRHSQGQPIRFEEDVRLAGRELYPGSSRGNLAAPIPTPVSASLSGSKGRRTKMKFPLPIPNYPICTYYPRQMFHSSTFYEHEQNRHTSSYLQPSTSFSSSTTSDSTHTHIPPALDDTDTTMTFEPSDLTTSMSGSYESFQSVLPGSIRWNGIGDGGSSTLSVNTCDYDYSDPTSVVVQEARRVPILPMRQGEVVVASHYTTATAVAVRLPSN